MQYKDAMNRIFRVEGSSSPAFSKDVASPYTTPPRSPLRVREELDDQGQGSDDILTSEEEEEFDVLELHNLTWITYVQKLSDYVLSFISPLIWILAFVIVMDREKLMDTWYMPLVGLGAAFLANTVPIGGGIVYVPVLSLIGVKMHLGVSFTVATMTIGNGVFGFFRWIVKDHSLIIWESFSFTVIPSSIGSLIGIFFMPAPATWIVRRCFALFCVMLAMFVFWAVRKGGFEKLFDGSTKRQPSYSDKLYLLIVSFLAGLLLVPNIGVGPALTTFLMLSLSGYDTKAAMVTGIITGGWVSLVPFCCHVYIGDVPWDLWVMVLPGVFYGAKYAPFVHHYFGVNIVMTAFGFFLLATSILFIVK